MSSSTLTLTHSLAHDPRTTLEMWLEEAETAARNLCPQHDPTDALTLVATDVVWREMPGNIANPAGVLQGDPPQYRARPTWDLPAQHANNAAAAAVSIYKQELTRHSDYTLAESALARALLASLGETNVVLLKTTYPNVKTYALTPRQIADTMIAKHGIPTSDDVNKLREPLSRALTSLSDLESHMGNFLLASQRLTRSGQGETPYHYFELYLLTVSGFPSVAHSMTAYYAQYPAILQQSLDTLFPFLEKMRDHLAKTDPASPFSGAAKGPSNQPKTRTKGYTRKGQQQKQEQRTPSQPTQHPNGRTQRWGPNGPVILAAHTSDPDPRDAKIEQLTAQLAGMTAAQSYGASNGMPDGHQESSQSTLFSSARPRAFYCWLHGWNNSHHGGQCKVMTNDTAYTARMKSATGPHGTGGNPKIGVPVTYHRPQFCFPLAQPLLCSTCPPTPNFNPPSVLSCSQACLDNIDSTPHPMMTYARTSCKRCRRRRLRVLRLLACAIKHALFFPPLPLSSLLLPCPL